MATDGRKLKCPSRKASRPAITPARRVSWVTVARVEINHLAITSKPSHTCLSFSLTGFCRANHQSLRSMLIPFPVSSSYQFIYAYIFYTEIPSPSMYQTYKKTPYPDETQNRVQRQVVEGTGRLPASAYT